MRRLLDADRYHRVSIFTSVPGGLRALLRHRDRLRSDALRGSARGGGYGLLLLLIYSLWAAPKTVFRYIHI